MPVEPSWPPVNPPGFAEAPGVAPVVQIVPAADQATAGAPVPPQAVPQRRPLHAGPPIPDPSMMTGQVPVRSLADRGPSTPAAPVAAQPVPPVEAEVESTLALPVQQLRAEQPASPVAAEPVAVAPVEAASVAAAPAPEAVAAPEAAVVPVVAAAPEVVAEQPVAAEAAASAEPAQPVVAPVAEAAGAQAAPAVVQEAEAQQSAEAQPVTEAQPVVADAPTAEEQGAVVAEAVAAEAAPVQEAVAEQPVAEQPAAAPEAAAAEAAAPEAAAPENNVVETSVVETTEQQAAEPQPEVAQPVAPAAEQAPAAPEAAQPVAAQQPVPGQPRRISAFLEGPDPVPLAPMDQTIEAQAKAQAQQPGEPVAEQPAVAEPEPAVEAQPVAEAPQPAEAQPAEEPAPEQAPAAPEEPQAEAAVPAQTPEPAPAEPQAAAPAEADPAPAIAPAAPETPAPDASEAQSAPEAQQATEVAPVAEQPTGAETEAESAADTAAEAPAEAASEEQAPAEPEPPRGPAAPGYEDAMREAVHQVMRERRDIRNGFRPDPVPHEVLLRVLEAAHTAPSVGYSQPWDFVVIRSSETRRKMHALAERQREAYADSLPKGRAKQFKEIKIEAILDTPVNIVVTADRTRGGRHTLGRHTQPQMAPYSAALAVENLWLAARAEGLGVGWVSFFDEEEMVRELGLPEHLDVVAYLCIGYVDAFPDEPELQQQGWAKKRPLSWVVHEEQYGNRALPGEEPHSVLSEALRTIRPLDAKALGEAWDRQKRMTKPAGSLGMLEIISAQLSGLSRKCPPPVPEPGCVAIFAGDHGVHAQGVTPWPQEVTGQMVANFLAGGAVVNSFAAQVGAEVCVVDVGVKAELPEAIQQGRTTGLLPRKVKPGTDDMTQGPAMSREEALKALEVGIETARDLVAAGNKILITGDMGIANTTASAALISVFTGADPVEVTGRGTGIDDETHARKVDVIRRALELHQPDPSDPIGVLAAVGGLEHAAIAGFLLGAASLRTPVILDGVIAGSAALVAKAIAPEVLAACIAGHRSAEPGHQAALAKLGLRPLIDLDLRLGEGTGALLALPLVQSAARAMHDVATFDSAGVTEKG
jgi:nicotinate-nucleotide--dimethylbenzimidazole phosphoribosyltransferase